MDTTQQSTNSSTTTESQTSNQPIPTATSTEPVQTSNPVEPITPSSEPVAQQPIPTSQEQNTQPQPEIDGTEKMLSALGYLGFLCILPIVLRRESAFCQYHGKQGLVLAIFDLVLRLFTVFGWFYTFLLIMYYAVIIYGMIRAYKGDYVKLPMISDIAKEIKV